MKQRPRRRYVCDACGGPAHRRTNVATRDGYEDADQPLLHLYDEDWRDNPHDVVPTDPQGQSPCLDFAPGESYPAYCKNCHFSKKAHELWEQWDREAHERKVKGAS